MTNAHRAVIAGTGILLAAFVVYGVYTWVQVIEVIPASYNCLTTLARISDQNAAVRPLFWTAFIISTIVYGLFCRRLYIGWRVVYLIVLGLGSALIVAPWLVGLFQS